MKKILYISLVTLLFVFSSGCAKDSDKRNTDSKLAKAKKVMNENLNNYSYDIKITTKTGIMDITTTMNCKDDRENKVSYCASSTYGVETEDYIDYKNKIAYSKVTTPISSDSANGKWNSAKYDGDDTNTWMNLNDYIFDITEETKDAGTYYTGTIDSKKLASAVSQVNADIDTSNIISDDIDIHVFVNSNNYIEKMSFTLKMMGIEEIVEINYKNYNTSGSIQIPSEVK